MEMTTDQKPDQSRLSAMLGQDNIIVTTVEQVLAWGQTRSFWPLTSGLACCAIEMMACGGGRFDMARFGYEVFRPSPRHADLLIVAGTVTKKMADPLVRLYEQMPETKWVIAMGSCAIGGGPFADSYSVVQGVDKLMPVDVYIPGCPPRPEALIHGMLTLREKVMESKRRGGKK